ncbi:hypothetical protein GC176_06205 [bacterium]|nr:hypothetical protein [bacterium]
MSSFKQTTGGLVGLALLVAAVAVSAQEANGPLILSTGVRFVGARQQQEPNVEQMPRIATAPTDGTRPTLPGGKLPQYQLDHRRRELATADDLNDPRLRFLLALPGQALLIEASLTIDGEPFRMARETRIQQLLEDLKREPEPASDSETKSDSVAKAETDSAADSGTPQEKSSEGESTPADPKADSEGAKPDESKSEIAQPGTEGQTESGSEPAEESKPAEEAETEEEKPKVNPPSVPAYSLPSNVLERLRRQVKATGEAVSVEELRWLLANWIDGPTLLLLKDHFQQFRANQRPVFTILDRNRDGVISADELARAVASFEECDLNRNDIVDYAEIERSAEDPRRKAVRYAGAGRLIFLLPDEKSMVETYSRLAEACHCNADVPAAVPMVPRFDADANGRFDPVELAALREATPDLNVSIVFDSKEPTKSQLTVEVPRPDSERPFAQVAVIGEPGNDGTLALFVDGQPVELSAVQDTVSDQVSLGAVNDGYPLLAAIDPNDDGRFTIRERRTLTEQLARFDRDKDGSLSSSEAQATIRVCFGLGATVHRELAQLRRVDRGPQTPVTPGPGWFVRMDRNKDNDLSRKEFPGTDEQFADLDADGDQLVSAEEARNASP